MLAAKGALYAEIETPRAGRFDFFNSHLGALTYREKDRRFISKPYGEGYRQKNSWVLFRVPARNETQILTIDSNSDPNQPMTQTSDYQALVERGRFSDTAVELSDRFPLQNTFDTRNNPYNLDRQFPSLRIDLILSRRNNTAFLPTRVDLDILIARPRQN